MGGLGGRAYVTRCHVCRKRKVKCGGEKPSCQRCVDARLVCTGYERSLQFSFFNGHSNQSKTAIQRRRPVKEALLAPKPCQSPQGPKGQPGVLASRGEQPRIHSNLQLADYSMDRTLAASQYEAAFVGVLQDRYIPTPAKNTIKEENICTSWVTTACDLSALASLKGSTWLPDSLLAVSLELVAEERGDRDISASGIHYYAKAISGLRVALEGNSDKQLCTDIGLVTCLACAMYEVMANRSFSFVMHHLGGIRALLLKRGVHHLRSATSQRIFYGYRCIDIAFSLVNRQASFLSLPEWINPPFKSLHSHGSNHMQTLLDSAFKIPVLMERFDCKRHSPVVNSQALNKTAEEAFDILASMKVWESLIREGDDTTQLYIPRLAGFLHSNEESGEDGKIFPFSYDFPSFDIATILVYYEMFQIFLYGILIDIKLCSPSARQSKSDQSDFDSPSIDIRDLTSKSIDCADRICQSAEYFFDGSTQITGRMVMLCPFQAAKSLFARLTQTGTGDDQQDIIMRRKVEFCNDVAKRFAEQELHAWGGQTLWGRNATE